MMKLEDLEPIEWWICTTGGPEGNGCGMKFIRPPDMPAAQCAIEFCPHCGQEYPT